MPLGDKIERALKKRRYTSMAKEDILLGQIRYLTWQSKYYFYFYRDTPLPVG